jgi:aminopeptidase N
MYEVYHEIGHTWNATSSTSVQRCRYFDEAFASFFQALAIRAFNGDAAFEAEMERSRASFSSRVVSDTLARMTAIAQYGTRDLGRYSYSKGAWSLYVLHELVGESAFNSIISSLVRDYATIPIDFSKFEDLCEQATHRNLGKFFQEWIFGTESSVLLTENVPIAEIVKRYK